jgi:hypothetical protein
MEAGDREMFIKMIKAAGSFTASCRCSWINSHITFITSYYPSLNRTRSRLYKPAGPIISPAFHPNEQLSSPAISSGVWGRGANPKVCSPRWLDQRAPQVKGG